MNTDFIKKLPRELSFPAQSLPVIDKSTDILASNFSNELEAAYRRFVDADFSWQDIEGFLSEIARKSAIHHYTVNLIFLLSCFEPLRQSFKENELPDKLFLDTSDDLRLKMLECHDVYGVFGIFTGFWYSIFFKLKLIRLGRLQYEIGTAPKDIHVQGVDIKEGSKSIFLHIPSGSSLDESAYIESYKQAYNFFDIKNNSSLLICLCESWLLHPSTFNLLPPSSNVGRFIRQFHIISHTDGPFDDKWRVFGKDFQLPDKDLPENTSMQRAYKQHLLQGGKTGIGLGMLVFNGNTVITSHD